MRYMKSCKDIVSELDKYSKEDIVKNVGQESVSVFLWIQKQVRMGRVNDPVFQFVFRSCYQLDGAGLSDAQKVKYFKLMGTKECELKTILNELYEIETRKGTQTIQFSFATKLLHTWDNTIPIYDSRVSEVIGCHVKGGDKETKLDSCTKILEEMKVLYKELLQESKVKEIIKLFHKKYDTQSDTILDAKVLDFLIWTLGKMKIDEKKKDRKERKETRTQSHS